METTTTETTMAAAAAARGFAEQTPGEQAFTLLVFGLSTAASAAFAYYLFTDPSRLTDLWTWTRSLPLLAQGVIWVLALPWMFALWVWSTPWALAVRLVIVLATLAFTQFLMWPWK